MGIQRAIVTNKKIKERKQIKTPPHNLLSNDRDSDLRSSQLLSVQHPRGLHCTWFREASTGAVNNQILIVILGRVVSQT